MEQAQKSESKEEILVFTEGMPQRVKELEGNLRKLARHLDERTDVFVSSFESVDQRLAIMFRIMNDLIVKGAPYTTQYDSEGPRELDYEQYMGEYGFMLSLITLATTHKTTARPIEPASPAPLFDADYVFGGLPMSKPMNRTNTFSGGREISGSPGKVVLYEEIQGGMRKLRCTRCGGTAVEKAVSGQKPTATCGSCGTTFTSIKM